MSISTFLKRSILVAVGLVVVAAIGVAILLRQPLRVSRPDVLFVPEGATVEQVIGQLESRSAIVAPWLWRALAHVAARFVPLGAKMGSYRLDDRTTHAELFENILRGRNRLVRRLTIYEGETVTHLAGSIARVLDCDSARVLRLLTSDSLVAAWNLGSDARSLEGFLLPATYDLFEREPLEHALRRIVHVFEQVWQQRFADAASRTRLSRYEILTLASIVEGEVINPIEYRRIAGVYWNRLRRGMKLEADPTVQYALGFPPRRLTYRDYRIEHPYNTYRIVGLPPGPVKAPSARAIEAVLDPERHDYVFFCGTGDSTGTHRFAATYREHLENVRRYYATLRQQGRLSDLTRR